jgi:ribosomal-protein-alanine N-acetyltransferase
MPLSFRKMREEDLEAVYEIETASFSDPWPREFFRMELDYDSFVAESEDGIAGFICTMQVMDECTVTNVSVCPELRRQGVAQFIFESLICEMDSRDVFYYYLEVRASNQAAYKLYIKLGFSQIGLRKDYYNNPIEDAIVMALNRRKKETDERL